MFFDSTAEAIADASKLDSFSWFFRGSLFTLSYSISKYYFEVLNSINVNTIIIRAKIRVSMMLM